MTPVPRSIPDVADHLIGEFEGRLSPPAITAIVIALSRDGSMSLEMLLELARTELELAITPAPSTARPEPPARGRAASRRHP